MARRTKTKRARRNVHQFYISLYFVSYIYYFFVADADAAFEEALNSGAISTPFNFGHKVHVDFDPSKGFIVRFLHSFSIHLSIFLLMFHLSCFDRVSLLSSKLR